MLTIPPPMTNVERQQKFQAAHPGYDARRKARRRAITKRASEMRKMNDHVEALARQSQAAAATAPTPANRPVLMLPAPAERIEIPGMTTIEPARQKVA